MNRTTDDLLDALLSKQDLPEYFEENDAELLRQTLAQELNALVEAHGLKKSEVIAGAQIERSYGYQLFSGRRGTPSRDVLLSLALSMRLTLPETQTLLRYAVSPCAAGQCHHPRPGGRIRRSPVQYAAGILQRNDFG